MSIAPHAILRPFGLNRFAGGYLRRHARPCLRRGSSTGATNGNELGGTSKERRKRPAEESRLEVLYDDGFGSVTMKDYQEAVMAMPKDDGGPPRWFCPVECGRPEVDRAPLLLFLPGTEGVGMELILQHKSLGKVFETRRGNERMRVAEARLAIDMATTEATVCAAAEEEAIHARILKKSQWMNMRALTREKNWVVLTWPDYHPKRRRKDNVGSGNSKNEQIRFNPVHVFDCYFREQDSKGTGKGKGSRR